MNDVLKYALLAGGGYLLYRNYAGALPAAPSAATVSAPPLVDTKALLAQQAAKLGFPAGTLLNSYAWDTIYQQVRGIPGPTAAQLGQGDPAKLISVSEFWAAASGAGFSGLGDYVYSESFVRLQGARRA